MPDSILHAEPYGAILLASDAPCLIVQWYGFANTRQLRFLKDQGLACYTEIAAERQPLAWLCDTRHMGAVRPQDQHWLATDWNPRAYQAGIRHLAFVRPENVFGQMSVDAHIASINSNPDYPILATQHQTLAAAKDWLRHVLKTA